MRLLSRTRRRLLASSCLATCALYAVPSFAEEPIVLPDVVIESGARDPRELLDTPAAVSVVTAEDIEKKQASNFADVLGAETGVTIFGGPRGISQEPNIRGFEDEQVVLRLDGARQNFNGAHRGRFFLDPDIVGRVEVLRGGASALYGSGALGGVVTIDTKNADDILAFDQNIGGRLKTGWNSQGDEFIASGTAAARYGMFDALGFVAWRPMSGDLTDGDGDDILDTDIDTLGGLFKLGFEPNPDHRIEVKYQRHDDEGDTPPNANAASTSTTKVSREMTAQSVTASWDWSPQGSKLVNLSAVAYWNAVDLTEDRVFDGRFDETKQSTIGVDLVNRSSFTIGLPVKLSYGVEAFQDSQEARRDGAVRTQSPDATRLMLAGFAQADISLTKTVTVTPGLRFDYFELDPESGFSDRSESQFSPRIAVNWRPVKNAQLWASASQSFRAPSLTELYATGVHFSTAGFPLGGPGSPTFTGVNEFVANPDLEPEKSSAIEVGGRYVATGLFSETATLSLSANAYAAHVTDFIDQTVTFIDFDTYDFITNTVSGTTRIDNVDAELWGFEAEADYDVKHWYAKVGLTIPRGRAADGGALGSIPADRLVFTTGFRPFEGFEIGGRATLADGQDDVPEESTPTPGYTVFDVFAVYEPVEALKLTAGVDNVLDRHYRVHPNGLDNPGLAVKLGASVKF